MNIEKLPNEIAVFPLSNVIFFPKTNLPLNIFEKRYVQMINDSLKKDRLIGIIQPKSDKKNKCNDLYSIGCLGKIDSFSETDDGRFIINLMGISRFKIEKEIEKGTLYRNFLVNYSSFSRDLINKYNLKRDTNFKTLFNKIKILFKRKKYLLNWKELEKLDLQLLINTIAISIQVPVVAIYFGLKTAGAFVLARVVFSGPIKVLGSKFLS